MLRKIALAFLFASIIATVGVSRQGNARYELYSWKQGSVWHYALFEEGTRAGSYEELISNRSALKGTAALEAALKKLPKGKEVLWMSDAPQGMGKPDGKVVPDISLPSRQRIKRVKAYCDKLGIKLTLV
ncbi:MAG: hypothetical protein AB1631_09970 [Acidobacteriota bacterium]